MTALSRSDLVRVPPYTASSADFNSFSTSTLFSASLMAFPPCLMAISLNSFPPMRRTDRTASAKMGLTTGSTSLICDHLVPWIPPVTPGSKRPPTSGRKALALSIRPFRISPELSSRTSLSVIGAATSSLSFRVTLTPACFRMARKRVNVFFSTGICGTRPLWNCFQNSRFREPRSTVPSRNKDRAL